MKIDLFKHFIPQIKETKNKSVFISSYCPVCNTDSGRIFRIHLKLKVFKCYNCGVSGKSIERFLKLIKISKINYLKSQKWVREFEVQTCITKEDSLLPF